MKYLNSANLGWFVLSQTILGIGNYAVMCALFRLRFHKHITIISVISFLSSMINYSIYFNKDHDGLAYIVPVIGMVIAFLYLAAVEKVPVIWSLIVTVAGGVIVPLIIQIAIIYCSFGFFDPSELKEHIWRNYAMDITSGFVYGMLAFVLYSQDWSFKFDFEKIRFKREKHLVIGISLFGAIYVPASVFITQIRDIDLNLAFLAVCSSLLFILLLFFAIKKEKSEVQYTKPITEVKTNV
ncbi:hypothetical protein COK00_11495 [Bacillus cereus]|uniref:hypothetical protein n=1 Tax=Bacillus cereus TaxID=1396 RepID=UPI000BFA75BB|nr:hypothetical protein [Bacillus cereus]PFP65237.1 hypothetical protein COK00_11495 [Bacillus cereus]PGT10203.1 hypothetical protein COD03_20860 [Bacillus cereus]